MKRSVPQVVDSGRVVAVAPALLTTKQAASFVACSPGFLNALRAADTRRRAVGEPLVGPAWQLLRWGVRYRLEDLRQWIEHGSIPFGVASWKRRGPKPANLEPADEAAS